MESTQPTESSFTQTIAPTLYTNGNRPPRSLDGSAPCADGTPAVVEMGDRGGNQLDVPRSALEKLRKLGR